eukprot:2561180-Rhodomonas_salina.1
MTSLGTMLTHPERCLSLIRASTPSCPGAPAPLSRVSDARCQLLRRTGMHTRVALAAPSS